MKGKYHIIVSDKKLRYEFDIKRNITIIRGDSATGKTTLIEMLDNYQRRGISSGVDVISEKKLVIAETDDWEYRIEKNPGSIIFVDEGNSFVTTQEFAEKVKGADNYFVLIIRDSLPNLPYSVEEIYGIRTSDKYAGLKQVYHEFYHLYGKQDLLGKEKIDKIIIEDSNAGYDFFNFLLERKCPAVISAEGKSNIINILKKDNSKYDLVIADGAAFGSEMNKIEALILCGRKIILYLPESFEWILLSADIFHDSEIKEILQTPENHIDSTLFFSWERYFTTLLIEKTKGTYLQYQKKNLNSSYLQGKIIEKIKEIFPKKIRDIMDSK